MLPDHVVDSGSNDQLWCSYRVELSQIDIHVLGCDAFGPFFKELTRGLVQVVVQMGYVIQDRKVPWLGSTYPLSSAFRGGRVYCICS